ncbi:amino acid deaminase/aldolase [Epidermidibacterium keratini]|uniref:Amino acid deaminase/aldolase n=1 Tax=Epidermidibacterium keratini TaxID=1891644 RepID=A0A7L4YRV0_9ACTN|nr:alanine racemase [Epidermidibacterium keratini]QHC01778.1 amino acid deaminase/aldolase [Epidermidibacterium keratini]
MTNFGADRCATYAELTADRPAPLGVLDLDALDLNVADMRRRAGTTAIRLATKSLRCRGLIEQLLTRDGIRGVLAFTLPEALWLHEHGVDDIVLGYPTTDRPALRALGRTNADRLPVVITVDSIEQVELARREAQPTQQRPLRLCLELDTSVRLGSRVHIGARRSPIRTPDELRTLARQLSAYPDVEVVGMLAYEGHIAGQYDAGSGPRAKAIRAFQRYARREIAERRAEAVAALREVCELEFVNGGGTGSLESTSSEDAVTEIAAGSGYLAPGLFDRYTTFQPTPAAFFALDVVRRPAPRVATALGGGWVASGPPGLDRLPTVAWPPGLRFAAMEAAGEVQTPLIGAAAAKLRAGDRVWLRHAKSGELSDRLDRYALVRGERLAGDWATYRGEGRAFL